MFCQCGVEAAAVQGPLSRVPATSVAVSIDGSKPQILQLSGLSGSLGPEDWGASSSCILAIPGILNPP